MQRAAHRLGRLLRGGPLHNRGAVVRRGAHHPTPPRPRTYPLPTPGSSAARSRPRRGGAATPFPTLTTSTSPSAGAPATPHATRSSSSHPFCRSPRSARARHWRPRWSSRWRAGGGGARTRLCSRLLCTRRRGCWWVAGAAHVWVCGALAVVGEASWQMGKGLPAPLTCMPVLVRCQRCGSPSPCRPPLQSMPDAWQFQTRRLRVCGTRGSGARVVQRCVGGLLRVAERSAAAAASTRVARGQSDGASERPIAGSDGACNICFLRVIIHTVKQAASSHRAPLGWQQQRHPAHLPSAYVPGSPYF